MRIIITATIILSAVIPLFAQETTEPEITAAAPWQALKSGRHTVYLNRSGGGQPGLKIAVSVKADSYYRLTWKMKGSDAGNPPGIMQVQESASGSIQPCSYFVTGNEGCYTMYFYSGKQTRAELQMSPVPKTTRNVQVSNISLQGLETTDFKENLFVDGEFEQPCSLPVQWEKCYWSKNFCGSVAQDDPVSENKCLKVDFTGEKCGVQAILPIIPRKEFEFTFWIRGKRESKIRVMFSSAAKGRHWYAKKIFEVKDIWQQCTMSVMIPSDEDYSGLKNHLLRVIIDPVKGELLPYEVYVDKMSFREVNSSAQ